MGRGSSLTCHKSPICLGKNPAGSLDNHNLKLCDHRLGYAKQIDSWRFRWKAMATEGRRHEFACWNGHITSCFLGTLRIQQRFLHHVSGVGERVNLESSISTTSPFTDQPYGNERRHYVAQEVIHKKLRQHTHVRKAPKHLGEKSRKMWRVKIPCFCCCFLLRLGGWIWSIFWGLVTLFSFFRFRVLFTVLSRVSFSGGWGPGFLPSWCLQPKRLLDGCCG